MNPKTKTPALNDAARHPFGINHNLHKVDRFCHLYRSWIRIWLFKIMADVKLISRWIKPACGGSAVSVRFRSWPALHNEWSSHKWYILCVWPRAGDFITEVAALLIGRLVKPEPSEVLAGPFQIQFWKFIIIEIIPVYCIPAESLFPPIKSAVCKCNFRETVLPGFLLGDRVSCTLYCSV